MTRRKKRRSRPLRIEQLEDRRLLAFGEVLSTQTINETDGGYLSAPPKGAFGHSATRVQLSGSQPFIIGNPFQSSGSLFVTDLDYANGSIRIHRSQEIGAEVGIQEAPSGGLNPFSQIDIEYFGSGNIVNIGDIDNDGNDDVVTNFMAGENGENVGLMTLFLDADGTAKSATPWLTSALGNGERLGIDGMAAADIDGDGKRELFVSLNASDIDEFLVYLNVQSNGELTLGRSYSLTNLGLNSRDTLFGSITSLGDIDGDGTAEMALSGLDREAGAISDYGVVYILSIRADGSVENTQRIGRGSGGRAEGFVRNDSDDKIASIDLNSDGRNELVVPDLNGLTVLFLTGLGLVDRSTRIAIDTSGFQGTFQSDFGLSLLDAGDQDDDGVPDLLMSHASEDTLYLLLMRPDGTVKSQVRYEAAADTRVRGPLNEGDWFGESIADVGDLDRDGVNDLVVGAPSFGTILGNMRKSGSLRVLYMNQDGTVKSHDIIDRTVNCTDCDIEVHSGFGAAVTTLGDLDSDGRIEIAVSSPVSEKIIILELDHVAENGSTGLVVTHLNTVVDPNDNGKTGFGTALAGVGDVDGNGVPDLAVGDPRSMNNRDHDGATWIFFLNADGSTAGRHKLTNGQGRWFGSALAPLGDVNGDDVPDLAVSTPISDPESNPNGSISILMLNRDGSIASEQRIGENAGGLADLSAGLNFGDALANIGDLDRNGVNDLLVQVNELCGVILLLKDDGTVSGQALVDNLNDTGTSISSVSSWNPRQNDRAINLVTGVLGVLNSQVGALSITKLPLQFDFGDAPDGADGTSPGNYETYAHDNGPQHFITDKLFMGARVDAELNARPNSHATGDDENPTIAANDEDGVEPADLISLKVGRPHFVRIKVTNDTTNDATLSGWIDFNGNGQFENSESGHFELVPAGTRDQSFSVVFDEVPLTSVANTFARFRLSTDPASSNPYGIASDGEVEDYAVTIDTVQSNVTPILLKDITVDGGTDIDYRSFFTVDDDTFFVVNDTELWVTKGQEDDAQKIADIESFTNPAAFDGSVYFWNGNDGIWRSDGTALGTESVISDYTINPNTFPTTRKHTMNQGIEIGGTFYFSHFHTTNTGNWGSGWLFESDGTEAGTKRIEQQVTNGALGYGAASLAELEGKLIYSGTGPNGVPGQSINGLWSYDGSVPTLISDQVPTVLEFIPTELRLYFTTRNMAGTRIQVWTTDGTASGTVLVKELGTSQSPKIVSFGSRAFLLDGAPGTGEHYLYELDETTAEQLVTIPGEYIPSVAELAVSETNIYFVAPVPTDTHQVSDLWVKPFAQDEARLVRNANTIPMFTSPNIRSLTTVGDIAYYHSFTFEERSELWRSDGTAEGTFLVRDLNPNGNGVALPSTSFESALHNANGQLIFAGSNGQDGIRGFEPWALVTIDPARLSIADAIVTESDAGSKAMEFTVTLSAETAPFTVDYTTRDATATAADGDYVATSGTLTFSGNANESHTISVEVSGDLVVELDEHFFVDLSNVSVSSIALADGRALGYIRNNDEARLSISDARVVENAGQQLVFSITLDKAVDTPIKVQYQTLDQTATVRRDYLARKGEHAFQGNAGESLTVSVSVLADNIVELDESVLLSLFDLETRGRDVSITNALAVGVIENDDQAVLTVTPEENVELDSGTRRFSFFVDPDRPVDYDYHYGWRINILASEADSTDILTHVDRDFVGPGFGYVERLGTTRDVGNFFSVLVVGDTHIELDEALVVELFESDFGGRDIIFGNANAVGTILNDDGADFGDAPSVYPVLLDVDAARHATVGPTLGELRDVEPNGQPSDQADGDDGDAALNDEDGVVFLGSLLAMADAATTSSVSVVASAIAKLDAWIDFNGDGDWDDEGEQVFASTDLVAGENTLNFVVPAGAVAGSTAARFRISSAGGLLPTGAAPDGEVEDYLVTLLDGDSSDDTIITVSPARPGTIDIVADGDDVVVRAGDAELFRGPRKAVDRFEFIGTDGDDTLVVEDATGFAASIRGDAGAGTDTLRLTGSGQDLDLTTTGLQGVEVIDVFGSGANVLTLNAAAVLSISSTTEILTVITDAEDTVNLGTGWTLDGTEVDSGRFVRVLTQNPTLRLFGPYDWNNPVNALDVNANGTVEPLDALVIINELNSPQFTNTDGSLRDAASLTEFPGFFYDSSSDGFTSPLDVLIVINFLNDRSLGTAEAETSATAHVEFATADTIKYTTSATSNSSIQLASDDRINLFGQAANDQSSQVQYLNDRTPEQHTTSDEELLDAIDELMTTGDWLEHQTRSTRM